MDSKTRAANMGMELHLQRLELDAANLTPGARRERRLQLLELEDMLPEYERCVSLGSAAPAIAKRFVRWYEAAAHLPGAVEVRDTGPERACVEYWPVREVR